MDGLEHRSLFAEIRPRHDPQATDESGDEKRARNAVASIVKAGLLIGAVGDDRYEVSEAVEPLLPLEVLQQLLESLQRANSREQPVPDADDDLFEPAPTGGQ